MLVPEVALRFRSGEDAGDDAIVIAVTTDVELVRKVARALLAEAEVAAKSVQRLDPVLSHLLEAEVQRLTGICAAVGAERREVRLLRMEGESCPRIKALPSEE